MLRQGRVLLRTSFLPPPLVAAGLVGAAPTPALQERQSHQPGAYEQRRARLWDGGHLDREVVVVAVAAVEGRVFPEEQPGPVDPGEVGAVTCGWLEAQSR